MNIQAYLPRLSITRLEALDPRGLHAIRLSIVIWFGGIATSRRLILFCPLTGSSYHASRHELTRRHAGGLLKPLDMPWSLQVRRNAGT